MKGKFKKILLLMMILPLTVYGKDTFNAEKAVKGLERSITKSISVEKGSGNYTVRFNANGGQGIMSDQIIPLNENRTLNLNSYSKNGYLFNAWNTLEDGSGTTYTNGQNVINLSNEDDNTVDLYASWSPISYNIAYDGNGGVGSMNTQTINYDVSQKLAFNGYTREGYVFTGWNTSRDGSGAGYEDQEEVINLTANNNATILLYAQWNANAFTVIFDANGGAGEMANQDFVYGTHQDLTENAFTKANNVFVEWNTKRDGSGTSYENGQDGSTITATNNGNVTLYAQWALEKYTLKFNANGGVGSMADQVYTYGEEQRISENTFTKADYTFTGWNTAEDGSGTAYADKELVTITASKTLYAQWAVNTYRVNYHPNDGTGSMSSQVIEIGKATALTQNSYVKEGYTFDKWNTELDGTGTSYNDKEEVLNLVTTNGGQVVLYAQWKVNTYKVAFDANGGEGEMEDETYTYGEFQELSANTFTKLRYRFVSWNTAEDGSGAEYQDMQNVRNLTAENNGTVTLYAQWADNTYRVVFNKNTGTGTMTDQTLIYGTSEKLLANTFTKEGHTFVNWNTKADGSGTAYADEQEVTEVLGTDENVANLYAQWSLNTYTVSFKVNGGIGEMENLVITHGEAQNLTANTYTRAGYTFSGWNTKPDGTGTDYEDEQEVSVLNGYTELYAQWTGIGFTVIFNANGGQGEMQNQNYIYGTSQNLSLNVFTKTKYGFKGWNTEEDGTGDFYEDGADASTITTTENDEVNLYAQWQTAKYQVKYNANGGEGTMENQEVLYGETVDLTPCSFTYAGRTFNGWNSEEDGSGINYTDGGSITNLTEEDDTVINLYAQWQINVFTVSYNANGGQGVMTNQLFTYDIEQKLATLGFSRNGYTFAGWNTAQDGTGTTYTADQKVKNLSDENQATVTLYAMWNGINYFVAFNPNGGTGEMANQSFIYGTSQELTENTFTKASYVFDKWNTAPDGSGTDYSEKQSVNNLTATVNEVITLYAQWKTANLVVTFDANGGEGTMATQTFTYGVAQTISPNTFTRNGYTFVGWNTERNGSGTSLTNEQEVTLDDLSVTTATLYAQWLENDVTITGITLNKTSLTLNIGDEETLVATITPSTSTNKTVTWTSNHPEIATVSQTGKVTAVAKGTAVITAKTSNNLEATCVVTVSNGEISVLYSTHIQEIGWQRYIADGNTAGTTGEARRLEAIKIKLANSPYTGSIEYRTHIQSYGWEKNFKKDDELSGTSGEAKRLEAIEIKLTGEVSNYYDVYYRVHAQKYGWLGWAKNGEASGTSGYAYRLEAIEIVLNPKGTNFPGYGNKKAFQKKQILYRTHVQTYGWQQEVADGNISGTVGEAKRLEAIQIILDKQEYTGNIEYRTHIQTFGWEKEFKRNGEVSGTSGLAKRLEAIQIKLTGEMATHYDVYYRVHAQKFGWLNWAKNGESAGTAGYGYRLEGIEIVVVEKGEQPPVRTDTNSIYAFRQTS